MNWFSFLFQPYARSSCVQIYEHEKLMQKIKVKIKTNEKECLWKNTCLLKVILTITKKASVQCNVNFICSVEQWMTGYGGWFTPLILLVDELFVVHDDSHSSTFRAMRNYTHFTTSRSRLQSIAQQFPIAFLLCISLTARACFFLFLFLFHFNRNNNKNSGSNILHFCEQIIIFCACVCHAMPIHTCLRKEWKESVWNLFILESELCCFRRVWNCVCVFLARLLTMFRFSLSKLFAIYFE